MPLSKKTGKSAYTKPQGQTEEHFSFPEEPVAQPVPVQPVASTDNAAPLTSQEEPPLVFRYGVDEPKPKSKQTVAVAGSRAAPPSTTAPNSRTAPPPMYGLVKDTPNLASLTSKEWEARCTR